MVAQLQWTPRTRVPRSARERERAEHADAGCLSSAGSALRHASVRALCRCGESPCRPVPSLEAQRIRRSPKQLLEHAKGHATDGRACRSRSIVVREEMPRLPMQQLCCWQAGRVAEGARRCASSPSSALVAVVVVLGEMKMKSKAKTKERGARERAAAGPRHPPTSATPSLTSLLVRR